MREEYNAYYYSFQSTGAPDVDRFLELLAAAGKSFHGTENWGDPDLVKYYSVDTGGLTYIEALQQQAIVIARRIFDEREKACAEINEEIKKCFEEDWGRYIRKAGNKRKALECYQRTVGSDLAKKRPLFLDTMERYHESLKGRDRKYALHGETFFRNWQDLEIDESSGNSFKNKRLAVDEWFHDKG